METQTEPGRAIFYVEGVDFDWSLLDTSDLSTIRGGSLALLRCAADLQAALGRSKAVTARHVASGASRVCFELAGSRHHIEAAALAAIGDLAAGFDFGVADHETRRALESGASPACAPHRFLNYVHGLAFADDETPASLDAAYREAVSQARRMQFDLLTVSGLDAQTAAAPCTRDGNRPGGESMFAPGADPGTTESVSGSVKARRMFGRAQRQAFYREQMGDTIAKTLNLHGGQTADGFCDSFEEIIARPPEGVRMPLRGKLAIFYADGNGFGRIREAISKDHVSLVAGHRLFSETLVDLQKSDLLPGLLKLFHTADPPSAAYWIDGDRRRLRLETLLWGGDEVRFAMPAWMGFAFARQFFECVAKWTVGAHPLTFTASMVVASYKTPIRQLIEFGDRLVDDAKQAETPESRLAIEILESHEPPTEPPGEWRRACLGLAGAPRREDYLFSGYELAETETRIGAFKSVLPRSQLYGWLQICARERLYEGAADCSLRRDIVRYASRAGRGKSLTPEALTLPNRSLAMSLYQVAQLWDYATPLGMEPSQ